jgi:predicted  nucleic acid-binding Zn-ribbon protein
MQIKNTQAILREKIEKQKEKLEKQRQKFLEKQKEFREEFKALSKKKTTKK